MEYLILIHDDEIAWAALPAAEARLVGPGGAVTDGPFTETKEQLGGVYVVDCADEAAAVAVARQLQWGTEVIEVRAEGVHR